MSEGVLPGARFRDPSGRTSLIPSRRKSLPGIGSWRAAGARNINECACLFVAALVHFLALFFASANPGALALGLFLRCVVPTLRNEEKCPGRV